MATIVTYNGNNYNVPAYGDTGWAQGTGNLSQYLIALASGSLQQTGGNFTLTSDVNFGASFGLISAYFTSEHANSASSGTIRLANTDTIDWRNFANTADLALGVNPSNQLTFQGVPIANPTSGTVNTGTQYQLAYYAATGSAVSGNPNVMSANEVVVTDANGVPTTTGNGGTTATEIGYVHGVTSSIQTQLNGKQSTGAYITALTGPVTATGPGSAATTITSGAVAGSTANSGGTQQQIAQGTVSTPDLRANAVTLPMISTSQTTGLAGTNTIQTVTITTVGGPVLLTGMANIQVTASGNQSSAQISLYRGGSPLSGGTMTVDDTNAGTTSPQLFLATQMIDTPIAGTHTYMLNYFIPQGTFLNQTSSLIAIELRA